jgi:HMG (high mobility group) box
MKKQDLIQRVAEEWRLLTGKERSEWDEVARDDKLRYVTKSA